MKIAAANKKLDAIIEKVEKEGITAAGLIEDLKELREFALKEGSEYPIEIEDKDNFLYLLNLLKNADHKINREEIKDYRTALKEELY